MTWTYNKDGLTAVVTAENCEMACIILNYRFQQKRIKQKCVNKDLVPVVTSTRWSRIFINGEPIKQASHDLKHMSSEPKSQ